MTYSDWREELSEGAKTRLVIKGLKAIKSVIKKGGKKITRDVGSIGAPKASGRIIRRNPDKSGVSGKSLERRVQDRNRKQNPNISSPSTNAKQLISKKEKGDYVPPTKEMSQNIRDILKKLRGENMNESVASLAVKGGSKLIPALMTGIGAAGTIMQAKRSQDTKQSRGRRSEKPKRKLSRMQQKMIDLENKRGENVTKSDPYKGMVKPKIGEVRKTEELIGKYKATNKVIKPKEGEVTKQRELLKNVEKNITKPKKGEKKGASKTVKDFLKARKKEGETMYRLKQDAEIADKGPGDLLPSAKKSYLEKLRRNLRKPENQFHTEDAIPTNSTGSAVPGTGDDSSTVVVKKKKRYIYGGTGSRKMWMNNK